MKKSLWKFQSALYVSLLLATTLFPGQSAGQNLIYSANYGTVDDGPYNVIATDVNGDGKPDLICANDGLFTDSSPGNTLTILTNNGNGTFTFSASLIVGYSPFVAAGDLNHDGKMDLISANYYLDNNFTTGNTLTILTNNGSGVFGSNATYVVGNGPTAVAAADLKNSGRLDLICVNSADGTLTVLTNTGNGKFAFNATYPVGNYPNSLVVADVNGDNKLDVVCANFNDSTLIVLTNNGAGILGSNATYTVDFGPITVAAADLNGDNKIDLITANDGIDYTTNTLSVLTNNGNGKFTLSATLHVGNNPYVTTGDMNGDNKIDLISANNGDGTITVLTNSGTGVFQNFITYSNLAYAPYSLLAEDVTGDAKPDLVVVNNNDSRLSVFMSSGAPLAPLNLQRLNATTALLSWPGDWFGLNIQQGTNLTAGVWSNVAATITVVNRTNQATIATTPGTKFFRLYH